MFLSIIHALVPIAIVIFLGWLAGHFKIIDNKHKEGFATYVTNFSFPCLLFVVTATSDISKLFAPSVILAFTFSLMVMYAIAWFFYRFFIRYNNAQSTQSAFVCGFPDMAFMGIPILASLLGPSSVVSVAIGNIVTSVLMIPITIALLEKKHTGKDQKFSDVVYTQLKYLIKKPLIVAPVLGIIYSSLGFSLPVLAKSSLLMVGKTTAGVSLFTLGLIMSSYAIKLSRHVITNILLKNIAHPLLAWGFVFVFGVTGVFAKEIIILCAMPTATITTMVAVKYDTLPEETTSSAILGTIISLVTLSVVLFALHV